MQALITITVFLIAIIVHEVAHGYVALRMGDSTALSAGRISFNPVSHIDPVGTILLPGILLVSGSPVVIGWAKPVPVNVANFRDSRKGLFFTSFAGPLSNFLLALCFAGVFWINALLLNSQLIYFFTFSGILISLVLGFFNMLPIPPLDGSGMVSSILSPRLAHKYNRLGRYGFLILIGLLYLGLIQKALFPLVGGLTRILIGHGLL